MSYSYNNEAHNNEAHNESYNKEAHEALEPHNAHEEKEFFQENDQQSDQQTIPKNKNSLKERVEVVDAVRGLALFGMLIANVGVFTHTYGNSGGLNDLASNIYTIFILNNYYVIFSILFGLSFYIFMSKPRNSKYIFLKRTFILLIIGFIHLIFFWHLDILHAYALTGFLLIFFYDMNLRSLKVWIAVMFILDIVFSAYLSTVILEHTLQPVTTSLTDSYGTSTYLENLDITLMNLNTVLSNTLVDIPRYLFLFLLGLYAGKSGIYAETKERLAQVLTACRFSLGATIVVAICWFVSLLYNLNDYINDYITDFINISYTLSITDPLSDIFNFLLACFYITFFVLLYHTVRDNYIFDRFRMIGKMTLTNYLAHSLIYLLLFYDFNLGLRYEYPTYLVPVIAIPIYFLQAELSKLWISRFGHGPMERIWRYLTYVNLS